MVQTRICYTSDFLISTLRACEKLPQWNMMYALHINLCTQHVCFYILGINSCVFKRLRVYKSFGKFKISYENINLDHINRKVLIIFFQVLSRFTFESLIYAIPIITSIHVGICVMLYKNI